MEKRQAETETRTKSELHLEAAQGTVGMMDISFSFECYGVNSQSDVIMAAQIKRINLSLRQTCSWLRFQLDSL